MERILIIDDEAHILETMKLAIESEEIEVATADSGQKGLELFRNGFFNAVITDLKMPKMSGIEVLDVIRKTSPEIPVIVLTAYGTVESAVEAMKRGAYDYISKPFDPDRMMTVLKNALERNRLVQQITDLKDHLRTKYNFENVIGASPAMQKVFESVTKVMNTKASVLVTGDSGTGKEVIAKLIHFNSDRREKPLVKVSCASLPQSLLEDELFGHEKGAFTDAVDKREGRFEIANGGTILLDEVGDIEMSTQAKLLRVIQEKEFERIGGNTLIKTDVRIISTTHKNLDREIREGRFRNDLYYRLNVINIKLPSLKDRRDDIPALAEYFLGTHQKEYKKNIRKMDDEVMRYFFEYDWPGNVRELENCIERAIVICESDRISLFDVPLNVRNAVETKRQTGMETESAEKENLNLPKAIEDIEIKMIRNALEKSGWVQAQTAELLGITTRQLGYKMEKYNISK